MFLEPAILSIIVGKLRRGKVRNLEYIHIRAWYLLVLSGALQGGLSLVKLYKPWLYNIIIGDYFFYLHFLSYLFLIIAISLNISKFSMKIFLIGIILNFLVIFSNGGKMPVSINGFKGIDNPKGNLVIRDFDIKHKSIDEDTRFPYLSDIIRIPPPYPLPKIISIGDIFLISGVFLFFQDSMLKTQDPKYN